MMNFYNYDLNKMFKDMMDSSKYNEPDTDLYENGDSYLALVDLPGVKKEDIKIDVVDNMLTVMAKRDRVNTDEMKSFSLERDYGEYKRTFELMDMNEEGVKAKYENGVLAIYVPKTTNTTTNKVIEIE